MQFASINLYLFNNVDTHHKIIIHNDIFLTFENHLNILEIETHPII